MDGADSLATTTEGGGSEGDLSLPSDLGETAGTHFMESTTLMPSGSILLSEDHQATVRYPYLSKEK